jgi:predicted  nucleic acid-binding Zn-ribbon protein
MSEDHPLLELQRLDSRCDALRARRAGLPERALLRGCESELAAVAQRREELRGQRTAFDREERRVEALVADLEAKARAVERDLYSGRITAPRELEALQLELSMIQRQQREREEEELVVLEQEERADGEATALDARRASLEEQAAGLRAALAEAEADIDAELGRLAAERPARVSRLSEVLLAAYEALRPHPRLAGRVAASIQGGACGGCHMALPTAAASRFAQEPSGAIIHCPHCGRILAH